MPRRVLNQSAPTPAQKEGPESSGQCGQCPNYRLKVIRSLKVFTLFEPLQSFVIYSSFKKQNELQDPTSSPELFPQKMGGADLGGGCWGCAPPSPEMTCGFLIQLVFCKKKICGLLVLKQSKRRLHPLLKKSWIRPYKLTLGSRGFFFLLILIARGEAASTRRKRQSREPYQTVSTVYFILGVS